MLLSPWPKSDPIIHFIFLRADVNKSLLNLHKVADSNNDPQMCDFIEGTFLQDQVKSIKTLADMVTQLNRVGDGKKMAEENFLLLRFLKLYMQDSVCIFGINNSTEMALVLVVELLATTTTTKKKLIHSG